ncbi:hypothetical protein S14_9 [Shewanella sp. phage 1/4]|uniref:hypothetical protein n=1 Tax=Shewanella phage 1/4 TaxID=1458859 RepID=UPI0004F91592|nr:hypothetical protein S14_9 [Shewanella sp. phage 1/4]AHK11121.1 hypothetical protein S14_9 [Shewanella sp. phage 1/4]
MKKTLAQLLIEYNIEKGYDVSIDGLRETLLECFPAKWQGDSVEHRWRVDESRVIEIMDGNTLRHFMFDVCTYSGDNSWEDAGFSWQSFDDMVEVEPKEVRSIKWVSVK